MKQKRRNKHQRHHMEDDQMSLYHSIRKSTTPKSQAHNKANKRKKKFDWRYELDEESLGKGG